MTYSPFSRTLALVLAVAFLMPSFFFMETPKAHAFPVEVTGTITLPFLGQTTLASIGTHIEATISAIANIANKIASYMLVIDKYVLEPIAFIESGQLLKAITAGVIQFVDGAANGTGIPQFVQDISGQLQAVADTQAFAFFSEFSAVSNSPFSSSIVSSLKQQYLQGSSLGGFFAANQCTLTSVSSNITGFLKGDWSQGGVGAWLALTTEQQNNPYMLFQQARAEGNALMVNAVNNTFAQLNWGQGFLSWCGSTDTLGGGVANPTTDACTQKDGTPGVIKTPGSVIKDALQKALGVNIDKLIQMGQVGPEINQILGDVAQVMNTLSFGEQLLGGNGSGGLAGLTSGGSGSVLSQYQSQGGYLGTTPADVLNNVNNTGVGSADLSTRVQQYQSSWNTINASLQSASSSVAKLIATCSAPLPTSTDPNIVWVPSSTAQTTLQEAQNAQSSVIIPTAQQYAQAQATIASAQAFVQQMQADANTGNSNTYVSDISTSQTMSPTAQDVANAQQQATTAGYAQASPAGSLNVSAASLVDQLNMIATNAAGLLGSCAPYQTGGAGGTNLGTGGE